MRSALGGFGSFLKSIAGVIVITTIIWHVILWGLNISFNYIVSIFIFIFDIVIGFYLLDRLIYFFSQFVLPIQNPKYRREIYSRVKNFETGRRGPALFIKNGRVITHAGEEDKRGPGVIVLDTASAAVLRTDSEIKDTVGPGVVFTKSYKYKDDYHNEYVAGSVDLRTQWQFIGPLTSEQPFLNPAPNSPPKSYDELQGRRQQTSGLTRDGFEVAPTISIKFSIKRPAKKTPSESGVTSQYGYDSISVQRAITREVVRLGASDNTKTRMEWNKLPAHLVVNLWREYIRKFKLEDLFTTGAVSGLQTIQEMINKRVRQENVVVLDDTGEPTGEWLESLEHKQLNARGLEISEVRIHNVIFDPAIEEQIVGQWNAEWMKIAKQEEKFLKDKGALIVTAAEEAASKRFARIASQKFDNPIAPPKDTFLTLIDLIEPFKESILSESGPNDEAEVQLRKLNEIRKWLLVNNLDRAYRQQDEAKS